MGDLDAPGVPDGAEHRLLVVPPDPAQLEGVAAAQRVRGGPYGRTKGAKRIVAVDVTGLPVGALVVPASTHENRTTELMLGHLTEQGVTDRLELVLVDRGVTAVAALTLGRQHGLEQLGDVHLAGRARARGRPARRRGARLPGGLPHPRR